MHGKVTMEKNKPSKGETTSFGFKRHKPQEKPALPSVAACVTKETIEPLVIPQLPKHGTPKLGRARKDGKSPNRFGFRPITTMSNKVADVQGDLKSEKESREISTKPAVAPTALKLSATRSMSESRCDKTKPAEVGKFTLHSSLLPRPQCPLRVAEQPDKWAKTLANRQTASSTSANKFGFRGSSAKQNSPDGTRLQIQQLAESPSATKHRPFQKRPTDININSGRSKSSIVHSTVNSQSWNGREPPPCMVDSVRSVESNEEKHCRDRESSEKELLGQNEEMAAEELWGHGEAMALEEDLSCLNDVDQSPGGMNPPLRSVLLKLEDPTFATLAALSRSGLLEDETSPESLASPDLSDEPPSVEPLPPPPLLSKDSPDTPMSPTHGSNSCSSDARDRDFLIDDEIGDQPGLVFNSAQNENLPETIASLAGQVSKVLSNFNGSPRKARVSRTSTGTLSPCDSLASDDLMIDFDKSEASHLEDLSEVDDSALRSEVETQSSQVMREWQSLLSAHPGLSHGMQNHRRSALSSLSSLGPPDSPKSSLPSPLKLNSRLGTSSSGGDLSNDSGIRVDRGTYESMFQDVIGIKTMLIRLKRALQESETLDPFDKNLKESRASSLCGLTVSQPGEDSPHQLADLRRQVLLLQYQMEEKDKLVGQLREALSKRPCDTSQTSSTTSNAATQTDRVRPLSTGPILLQSSANDSSPTLVSCSPKR